jgi:hypothetical protein
MAAVPIPDASVRIPIMMGKVTRSNEEGNGEGLVSPQRPPHPRTSTTKTVPSKGAAAIGNINDRGAPSDPLRRESRPSSPDEDDDGNGDAPVLPQDYSAQMLHVVSIRFPDRRRSNWAWDGAAAAAAPAAGRDEGDDLVVRPVLAAVERWKDGTLGSGNDYFVPRPRTLRALNAALSREILDTLAAGAGAAGPSAVYLTAATDAPALPEVSVLCNCARFDVMVAVAPSTSASNSSCAESMVRGAVARTLLRQVRGGRQASSPNFLNWTSFRLPRFFSSMAADDPSRVAAVPTTTPSHGDSLDEELVDRIAGTFRVRTGPEDVARYLCTVAAGIAGATNKSHRRQNVASSGSSDDDAVQFRPYSSRDAHILLQLKRTLDVTSGPVLSSLLRSALEAGKGSRNAQVVPAIRMLQQYTAGSESGGGRYGGIGAGPAPPHVVREAVEQAREAAIEPAVRRYCDAYAARLATRDIAHLHRAVRDLVERHQLQKEGGGDTAQTAIITPRAVRELLHNATIALRRGGSVQVGDVLVEATRLLKEAG